MALRRAITEAAPTIVETDITDVTFPSLLDTSYLRYAKKVLEDRALPDARDGLKPSQRRILVGMDDLKLSPTAKTTKSAKLVGTVMGCYHPHGDSAIYDAMAVMTQPWKMRYPLVQGQGNWGSISGDSQAAARYTECRMSRFGELMLTDLSKDTAPYIPTYDDQAVEPTVLPTALPNLLLNGGMGIAVGLAAKFAPHNWRELAAVIKAYVENPNLTIDEAIALMPGPDFPTGGVLRGNSGVRDYYSTGRGTIQLEGTWEIETGAKGNPRIIITGVPFEVSPEKLAVDIRDLALAKRIEGITDIRDLSHGKDGNTIIRVVVDLAKTASPQRVINQLLKLTSLRVNFSVNQNVLIGGRVVENATLMQLIGAFVSHRLAVLQNKYAAEKASAEARRHILEGLLQVTQDVDRSIALIRAADGKSDAILALIAAGIISTEIQGEAVLAISLGQLTRLEGSKLQAEDSKLGARIVELSTLLTNEKKVLRIIAREQEELSAKYSDARRTVVAEEANDISAEEMIPEETIVVSLTKDGYTKRVGLDSYRVQGRGGKGVTGVRGREGDDADDFFICSTHDTILFFTNRGMVYRKKGYDIPAAQRTGKGTHLANLLALSAEEHVTSTITLKSLDADGYLVMVTRNGLIKRSELRAYNTALKVRGLTAINLQEGDELLFVEVTNGSRDLFLATAEGKAIRYPESLVRCTGRATTGVLAMNLGEGDVIAQMLTLARDENPTVIVITSGGFAKRSDASQYRCLQGRYAKGVDTIDKLKADRNGLIVAACVVTDEDTLVILTTKGKIMMSPVASIRQVGRTAMGVRAIKLDDGDSVRAVVKARPADNTDISEDA